MGVSIESDSEFRIPTNNLQSVFLNLFLGSCRMLQGISFHTLASHKEQRHISFQNISLKTMRLGVLSCEKLKHRETHGRIVSLDRLRRGVEEQLLVFSASCLSPGRVKKLQKFINFCLKVGHSSNLKHLKSI